MNKKILIILSRQSFGQAELYSRSHIAIAEGYTGYGNGNRGVALAVRELNLTDDQRAQVVTIFEFEISNFRSRISNLISRISNLKFEISNLISHISNFKSQI